MKQLIEYMSGKIKVQSKIGEGTTFTFTLPVDDSATTYDNVTIIRNGERLAQGSKNVFIDEGKLIEVPDTVEEMQRESNGNRPKIIFVDDDPINLHVIKVVLHNEKYDVTTVLSGEEVIGLLTKMEYDLIIADVMMPHMSGFALTEKIRKRFTMSELPILLLTSRGRIHDVKQGFDVGANDYVTKPIDEVELKSRVKALVDVRTTARERLDLESAFLQAQIQPHFIFNTMNSIMALSEIDLNRMQKLLGAFSDVLRNKFQFTEMKQFVPLSRELQLIETYLYIEQVRFGERVQVEWEIDDYKDVHIPPLTIQPLVENAIIHGISRLPYGGTILIKVINHQEKVEIVVKDDGVGIPEEKLDRNNKREKVGISGVGIYNTNLRLLRAYGSTLNIESAKGKGTQITFFIPKEKRSNL